MTPKEEMKIEFRMLGIEGNVRSWHLRESITSTDSMHTNFTDVYGADVLVVMPFLWYTLLYYERSVGDHLWRYGLVETDFEALHDLLLEGFLKDLVVVRPWVPVMLFYGVRTGADCLYQKTDETKGRKFITSMSLPSILWRTSAEPIP